MNSKQSISFPLDELLESVEFQEQKLLMLNKIKIKVERRRAQNSISLKSRFRVVWTVTRVFVITYFLFAIPFRCAFYCDGLYFLNASSPIATPSSFDYPFQLSMIADWICDLFLYIDMFLTIRYFAQRVKKEVIYHPKLLWRYYWRSGRFFVDCIALFPIDYIMFIPRRFSTDSSSSWFYIYYLRLLRLLLLPTVFSRVPYKNLIASDVLRKLLKLFFYFLTALHVFACIWHLTRVYNIQEELELGASNFILAVDCTTYGCIPLKQGLQTNLPATNYLMSFYFVSICVASVGYGDVLAYGKYSQMEVIVFMVFGWAVKAFFVGFFIAFVKNMAASRDSFRDKMRGLALFFQRLDNVRKKKLMDVRDGNKVEASKVAEISSASEDLARKSIEHSYKRWKHAEGEKDILENLLPAVFKPEVYSELVGETLKQVRFFRTAPPNFIRALALRVESFVFPPSHIIISKGEAVSKLWMISSGSVRVLDDNPERGVFTEIEILKSGKAFGTALLAADTAPIIASHCYQSHSSWVDLFSLSKSDVQEVLESYPECRSEIVESWKTDAESIRSSGARLPTSLSDYTLLSADSTTAEREADTAFQLRHTRDPSRAWWMAFNMLGIIYNLLVVPMRIAFWFKGNPGQYEHFGGGTYFFALCTVDWIIDIVTIVDIYLRCAHFSFKSNILEKTLHLRGKAGCYGRLHRSGYLYSWYFFLDVFSVLPLEFFFFFPLYRSGVLLWNGMYLFRLNRIFRGYLVLEAFFAFSHFWDSIKTGKRTKSNSKIVNLGRTKPDSDSILMLLFGGFVFFGVMHYVACFWYVLGAQNILFAGELGEIDLSSTATSWLANDLFALDTNFSHPDKARSLYMGNIEPYFRSLYWVLVTASTLGYGDISPVSKFEVVYAVFVIIIGTFVYALLLAFLTLIMDQMSEVIQAHNSEQEQISSYLTLRKYEMPAKPHLFSESESKLNRDAIQNSVDNYFQYKWNEEGGQHHERNQRSLLLAILPESIQQDLLAFTHGLLRKLKLFEKIELPSGFLRALSLKLDPLLIMPGDVIIDFEEVSPNAFFLFFGKVSKVSKVSEFETSEDDIDWKSELCFNQEIFQCDSSVSIPACKYRYKSSTQDGKPVHLYALSRANLDEQLGHFPEILAEVTKCRKNPADITPASTGWTRTKTVRAQSNFLLADLSDKDSSDSAKRPWSYTGVNSVTWSSVSLIIIVVYAIQLPYRVVHLALWEEYSADSSAWPFVLLCLDILTDLFFCVDIFLRSRYIESRELSTSTVEMDSKERTHKIWKTYRASGFFKLDLLATFFPVSLCQAVVAFCSPGLTCYVSLKIRGALLFLALLRLIRLTRLSKYTEIIEEYNNRQTVNMDPAYIRILQQVIRLVIGCFWLACTFFVFGRRWQHEADKSNKSSWINFNNPLCGTEDKDTSILIISLYYVVVTIATVGYGLFLSLLF